MGIKRMGLLVFCGLLVMPVCFAQGIRVKNDSLGKKLLFGNEKISIGLDYAGKVNIFLLSVNGQKVIDGPAGVYSEIRTQQAVYSTLHCTAVPVVKVLGNLITIGGIVYGDQDVTIRETWKFTVTPDNIIFEIGRGMSKGIVAEEASLPLFMFTNMDAWEGAYQDYGGLAWFYLFNKRLDTYGVHARSSQFWNSRTGNGLGVVVDAPGAAVAMKYTRTATDQLAYSIVASKAEMTPRYDSGTHRRRYVRDGTDVWDAFTMRAGVSKQKVTLSYFDFNTKYGRGKMTGINGDQVSAVLNTIARIGVIDKQHFGGNSWHTPYGPICLHEQYIAQMGLAINDSGYLKGYKDCLDFYRDNAIKPDGRVWPRWAYSNEDMMPGEVTDKGFYEAQWGYLLDANPDLVTNVAELYDLTGDKTWVRAHQRSCERALDWLLNRDSNKNGLVEMITDSHTQKRGSDWIDIIWSSYENAFVNAKLYHALVLWAAIERQLGRAEKGDYYAAAARKLQVSFNKPVSEGGFWDEEQHCYIHWRDKDGSIHGNNMVTPVNFMAIGYGICEDDTRRTAILDKIEGQMEKEKLFFWPICMYSYQPGEGNDWQFPFPKYENGDIFLSWGALGVKAYASYKPELAVKYVRNVLEQYAKDGLAFQRYGRAKQDGLGDDILSGNCLSVIGLYQAVYGINPLYNRLYLDPHITEQLAGTQLKYNFRGQKMTIDLAVQDYALSNGQFSIRAKTDFGFYATAHALSYFHKNDTRVSLQAEVAAGSKLELNVASWGRDQVSWTGSGAGAVIYRVYDRSPNTFYTISVNDKVLRRVKTDANGHLAFDHRGAQGERYRFSIASL